MIRVIVFDTDGPFRQDGRHSAVDPRARMAGLTLLRRTILHAWRAGAQAAFVVARDEAAAQLWASSEKGLPIPVTVLREGEGVPHVAPDDTLIWVSAHVWAPESTLTRLIAGHHGTPLAAYQQDAGISGPVVTSGSAVVSGGAAAEVLRRLLSGAGRLEAPYKHVDSEEARRATERSFYVGLTSVTDGYVDRVFNRHISAWFTRLVIDLPVSPNHVTWLHFSFGLVAAWLFWQESYPLGLLGALLYQLSVALDCSDGEIARLKFQFSKFGSWLDVVTDNIVTVAIFAAVAKVAATRLGPATGITLGVLAVSGVVMSVIVVFGLARLQNRLRPGQASSLAVTNRLGELDQAKSAGGTTLDRVINELTSRDHSVIVVLLALAGHLEYFAWLAGVGSHLFWASFAAIQLSMLRTANAQSR